MTDVVSILPGKTALSHWRRVLAGAPVSLEPLSWPQVEAAAAVIAIGPGVMIPMHRFEADLQRLVNLVEAKSDIKILSLAVGESYSFT